jgi:hypothetical protein
MRPLVQTGILRVLAATVAALTLWPAASARGETFTDVAVEVARLRARVADISAHEQRCLAGATQPVWTAAVTSDLKALRERADRAAAEGSAREARQWKELAQKAAALEANAARSARAGVDLFQSQQIGLECLDRYAEEREALRASLEMAVTDPAAYVDSVRRVRGRGPAPLREDLVGLEERSRALSARWKETRADMNTGAEALKADLAALKRRHTAALESASARALADPVLRAAEALVATAAAWEQARSAAARAGGAEDAAGRLAAAKERDEATRLAQGYWATADRLLGRQVAESTRTGTGSAGAGGTP